jgi:hypothetical protein
MGMIVRSAARPLGFTRVTSVSAATALPNIPVGTLRVVVQVEGAGVRWRDDGTAPTGTIGMLLNAGEELDYDGKVANLQFIQTAPTATLNVAYYE